MTPTTVEIVPARRKGITGYVNVGRGTDLGNPWKVGESIEPGVRSLRPIVITPSLAVHLYRRTFWSDYHRQCVARKLLLRDSPDGVLRIACPCNGLFHAWPDPCHATVIKEFLEGEIALRWKEVEK